MGRVEGKVALITGAARGQGRSHAVRLAEEGADIIAVDICEQIETVPFEMSTEEDLAETVRLVEETDRRIVARKADVRDEEGLRAAVDEGVEELGRLDIVLANAGIFTDGPSLEITAAKWNDAIDVCLTGAWNTSTIGGRHIVEGGEGGSIVITGSMLALHGAGYVLPYAAAKHGLIGVMRSLAIEWGPQMIRVNSVHPTQTDTPMFMNPHMFGVFARGVENPTREDAEAASQAKHTLPVPWIEPIDVSNVILFLVSDEARYITGVPFPVDCGANLVD